MLDRLKSIEDRYEKLNELLSDPEVVNDPKKLREYSKEQSDLQETVEVYRRYRSASEQLSDAKAMLEEKLDSDMREMVKEEISELQEEIESLTDQLKVLLIPKDPNDDKTLSWKPRRSGRRRGCFVCGQPVPHVQPLRRAPRLENRSDGSEYDRHRRI